MVFAGGIGEKAPAVRARICTGLGFLGINLDTTRNQDNAAVISSDTSVAFEVRDKLIDLQKQHRIRLPGVGQGPLEAEQVGNLARVL